MDNSVRQYYNIVMPNINKKIIGNTAPLIKDIGSGIHIHFFSNYDLDGKDYPERVDGFGRLRVSEPRTIFDSKFISSSSATDAKFPEVWSEQIDNISGAASSTHSSANAAITMTAGLNDSVIRQTKVRFNYQSGKNQKVDLTGILGNGFSGVTTEIGVHDGINGIYFESLNGIVSVCVKKAGVITRTNQSDWNIDPMDGSGPSGIVANWNNTQIFVIEYEWLGVGGVAFGLFINRKLHYVHFQNESNSSGDGAYISTPNLPIRYSISNTTSTLASMMQICSTVISEGGVSQTGQLRYGSLGVGSANEITAGTVGISYAICGIRLKQTHKGFTARPTGITLLNTSNGDVEWKMHLNPTISEDMVYTDQQNSAVQFGRGGGSIINNGIVVAGGYVSNDLSGQTGSIESSYSLGFDLNSSSDQFVLSVNPLIVNQDILAGITWREQ